jgi:hypothetical protein
MTTGQQALFLTFADETGSDEAVHEAVHPEVHPEVLMSSLSPEQVSVLHEFCEDLEAGEFIKYLQQHVVAERASAGDAEQDQMKGAARSSEISEFLKLPRHAKVQISFANTKSVSQDVERKAVMIEQLTADAAVRKMFEGLSPHELKRKTLETFQAVDADGNRQLDKDEFAQAFALMGLKLAPKDRDALFAEVDVDRSGTVDLEEFCQMVKMYLDKSGTLDKKTLGDPMKVLFDRFDTDGSGGLDEKEFVVTKLTKYPLRTN